MKPDRNKRTLLKILPALAVAAPMGSRRATKEVGDCRAGGFSRQASARVVGAAYLDCHPQYSSFSN